MFYDFGGCCKEISLVPSLPLIVDMSVEDVVAFLTARGVPEPEVEAVRKDKVSHKIL